MKDTNKLLKKSFDKVFPKKKNVKNITNLKINSFEEGDSVAHLNFLLEIEKNFRVRFSLDEMSEIKSVKQILKKIDK